MASWVACERNHGAGACRPEAVRLAKTGVIGKCRRADCGADVRDFVGHRYPGKGQATYRLVHVARLHSDAEAESEGYDPMLFVLENAASRERVLWPFYWTKDRHKRWHVGQYPPLISAKELGGLIKRLSGSERREVRRAMA